VEPILREVERREGESVVEQLVAEVQRHGLGVAGLEATKRALEAGQARTLVIDDQRELPEAERADLARLVALTSARVETVSGEPALIAIGGVGALLRYRTGIEQGE
jgi:stalled ribosome rescue protein Dom34